MNLHSTDLNVNPNPDATAITQKQDKDKQNDKSSVETINQLSYYVFIGIIIGFGAIVIAGFIDANYYRHNELFKVATMVIIIAYLLDVVSGRNIFTVIFFLYFILILQIIS